MSLTVEVILIVIAVVLMTALFIGPRRRPPTPSDPAGPGNPQDVYPLFRLWRQRRAAAGKGDNWMTRPLIKIKPDGSTEFLPKDDSKP
jgi:hypothetical protein